MKAKARHPSLASTGFIGLLAFAVATVLLFRGCAIEHARGQNQFAPVVANKADSWFVSGPRGDLPAQFNLSGGVEGHATMRRDGTGRINPARGFLAGDVKASDCTDPSRYQARPAQNTSLVTDRLLDALEHAESRGNPKARGDHGRAVGLFQMHVPACHDANRLRAAHGLPAISPRLRTQPRASRELARWYLRSLEISYTAAQRKPPTATTLIALWNRGPHSFQRRGFFVPKATQQLLARMEVDR